MTIVDEHLVNLAKETGRDKLREIFKKSIDAVNEIGF